jgi:hypothetical protein
MKPIPKTYAIRVVGHLDDRWSARLGGLAITRNRDGTTTLAGAVADQAHLHGVLAGLRDIGVTLLSLRGIDLTGEGERPDGGGNRQPSVDGGFDEIAR